MANILIRAGMWLGFAYFISRVCDSMIHSPVLLKLQMAIVTGLLPSLSNISGYTIELMDGRKYELVSTGLQAFVAATWGFLFGCAFFRKWVWMSLGFMFCGWLAGFASRTVSLLVLIHSRVDLSFQLTLQIVLILLFASAVLIADRLGRQANAKKIEPSAPGNSRQADQLT